MGVSEHGDECHKMTSIRNIDDDSPVEYNIYIYILYIIYIYIYHIYIYIHHIYIHHTSYIYNVMVS